ncbi:MAG: hypothetical protein RXR20_08785 [Paraburkholderia sp.]|jgi:hypothetical protein|uniref:hypothetical protein n=1 Tax=Burkholderiaceae TaxID=119060 RepID=UPI0010F59B5A|nr:MULTISPECIES: hypothetical protein [Burkholderiaceae]WCM20068.1 hypothetical protein NDK50_00885 [Paraburkholderia bryophila]
MHGQTAEVSALISDFTRRLADLGHSAVVALAHDDVPARRGIAIFFGNHRDAFYGPYFDMERGHRCVQENLGDKELRDACISTWPGDWPPDHTVARTAPPPVRVAQRPELARHLGDLLTNWLPGDVAPARHGEYEVKRFGAVKRDTFSVAGWQHGTPDKWRGLDLLLTPQRERSLMSAFRDGDMNAGFLLMLDAHSRRGSVNPTFTLDDKWALRAATCACLLHLCEVGRPLLELVKDYAPPLRLKAGRPEVIRERARAFEQGEPL